MLFSVDVGNTQTTLGLFEEDGELLRQWRMATDATDTADELHARLHGFFAARGLGLDCIKYTSIASVVPMLTRNWVRVARDTGGHEPFVIDASRDCGIDVRMPVPSQVGADRIANAIAARESYGSPVIVVDFGTATNIDVVDANGSFRGGAIMPGVLSSAEALFSHAAKLSSVPLVKPEHALGTTTEEAIQSGIVLGAAAQAEGLVRRIIDELATESPTMPRPTVVGTGGYATEVARATDLFDVVDPELTIRGIYLITAHAYAKHMARER